VRRPEVKGGSDIRPGWATYGLLGAFLLGSLFPLYWSLLIGSYDAGVVNRGLPPLIPGGNFVANAAVRSRDDPPRMRQ